MANETTNHIHSANKAARTASGADVFDAEMRGFMRSSVPYGQNTGKPASPLKRLLEKNAAANKADLEDPVTQRAKEIKFLKAAQALKPLFEAIIARPGTSSVSEEKRLAAVSMLNAVHVLTDEFAQKMGLRTGNKLDELSIRSVISDIVAQKWRIDGTPDAKDEIEIICGLLSDRKLIDDVSQWGDFRQAETEQDAELMLKLSVMKAYQPLMSDIISPWCFWKDANAKQEIAERILDLLSVKVAEVADSLPEHDNSAKARLMFTQSVIDKVFTFARAEYASYAKEALHEAKTNDPEKKKEVIEKWKSADIPYMVADRVNSTMTAYMSAVNRFIKQSDDAFDKRRGIENGRG